MAFFLVYIREAHPVGSRQPDRKIQVEDPTTAEERQELAQTCTTDLGLQMPVLIDGLDNAAALAYNSFPDRLFLVDTEQRIAYRGGKGPRGFKPAELEAALERLLRE